MPAYSWLYLPAHETLHRRADNLVLRRSILCPELLHGGEVYHPLPIDAESDGFGGVVVSWDLKLREVMLVELVNGARFRQWKLLVAVGDQLLEGVMLLLDALAFFPFAARPST